jgi:hypothetical protein
MNEQFITITQLVQMIIIIVAFISIVCLRRGSRLKKFWMGMIRQWRAAAILTLIYLIAFGISLTAFEIKVPHILVSVVGGGAYAFCLIYYAGTWIYR